MPTLGQILETQNQGVRQNPYFYRIVDILKVYKACSSEDNCTVKEARNGILYRNIESIPTEYHNRLVYFLEPGIDEETKYLYLRIVLI